MKTYTITELTELTGQNRTKVRRAIKRLKLSEINEDREHSNIAKEYSEESKDILTQELGSEEDAQQSHASSKPDAEQGTHQEQQGDTQADMIELLTEQLNKANTREIELLRLLDQQQRLALTNQQKLEVLEIELEEEQEESKGIFSNLFRKK